MATINTTMYASSNGGASWDAVGAGTAKYTDRKGADERVCYVFTYAPTAGYKAEGIAFTIAMMGISGYNWNGPWTVELCEGDRPNDSVIASATETGQLKGNGYTDVTFNLAIFDTTVLNKETQLCASIYTPNKTAVWTGTADVTEVAAHIDVIYTYGGEEIADKKTPGEALTLRGVSFYRNGYTQIGWSTAEGGEISHSFGESYAADKELTLYPVWGIAPSAVLWLLLRQIEKTRKQRTENNSKR